MGYTVKLGETPQGHFETRAEAMELVKKLCRSEHPLAVHISTGGTERYSDPLKNVVSLIPDPAPEN